MRDSQREIASPTDAWPWLPASAGAAPNSSHVPALDGIRGIAILVVLVYHFANSLEVLGLSTPALKLFSMGWCGVDIFFALSGFLITGILLDTHSAPRYFQSFYARRVLRIFPLYYLALATVLLLQAWIPDAGAWGSRATITSPASLMWPAAFLENIAIALGGRGPTGVTTHYWSLAVEEHFYLVWPLLVLLARSPKQILVLGLLALCASTAGRALALWRHVDLNHVFGLTPIRVDGLGLGACTAVLVRRYDIAKLSRAAGVILVLCLASLGALAVIRRTLEQSDPAFWLVGFPLVSLAAAAAIVRVQAGGMLARILSLGFLRWLGKYSYGLYVWHPIIGVLLLHSSVALTHPGSPIPQVLLAVAAVAALDFVVAWLSYQMVERRFLALKGRFNPYRPVEPAAPSAEAAGVQAQIVP